jgi:3-phenylpropionate/cinnamic acid dioxygenase small subunit
MDTYVAQRAKATNGLVLEDRERHLFRVARRAFADVSCDFVTYRAKRGVVDTCYGKHVYRIDCAWRPWKIKAKRSILDMDMLYPGKLTIIV